MLICYLDDSGKDPQNVVTTLAGYIARDKAWTEFEVSVEPVFEKSHVKILHAKELAAGDGEFKGWRVLQKQAFVAQISNTLSRHSMLGISMSCAKDVYDERAKDSGRKRVNRPYTFCFNVIIDWILRDIRIGRAAWDEEVSLVLESGHENNPEAEQAFYNVREQHNLEKVLLSLSFVPKNSCRAIQAADLFAYYSRRESNALEKASRTGEEPPRMETMLRIITERGQFRGYVANDFGFGPSPVGSRYLSDGLKK